MQYQLLDCKQRPIHKKTQRISEEVQRRFRIFRHPSLERP